MNDLIPLIKESFQKQQDVTIKVKGTSMKPFFVDKETDVVLSPFKGVPKKLKVVYQL